MAPKPPPPRSKKRSKGGSRHFTAGCQHSRLFCQYSPYFPSSRPCRKCRATKCPTPLAFSPLKNKLLAPDLLRTLYDTPRKLSEEYTLSYNIPSSLLGSFGGVRPMPEDCSPKETNGRFFKTLPLELNFAIIEHLDVLSLIRFSFVSRRANVLVNILEPVNLLLTHMPSVLWALILTGLDNRVSLRNLAGVLSSSQCDRCGEFGGYLYLMTCTRVCFRCFTEEDSFHPLPPHIAGGLFGLCVDDIKKLPSMRVIPGIYSTARKGVSETCVLIDRDSARRAGIRRHRSERAALSYSDPSELLELREYQVFEEARASLALNQFPVKFDRFGDDACPLHQCFGVTNVDNPARFVGIVRIPWLDEKKRSIDWGYHCIDCEKSKTVEPNRRKKYSTSEMREHVLTCPFRKKTLSYHANVVSGMKLPSVGWL